MFLLLYLFQKRKNRYVLILEIKYAFIIIESFFDYQNLNYMSNSDDILQNGHSKNIFSIHAYHSDFI